MRTLLLLATAALPLAALHALEAVAQSPVGGGSSFGATNLATDAKLSAVKAQTSGLVHSVYQLKEELKNFTDCAAEVNLCNGSSCVVVNVDNEDDRNKRDNGSIFLPRVRPVRRWLTLMAKSLSVRMPRMLQSKSGRT